MRDGFVIFKDQKPRDNEEICDSIEHFCIDHDFEFEIQHDKDTVFLKKDGELFEVKLEQLRERRMHPCWLIGCWHKEMVAARS